MDLAKVTHLVVAVVEPRPEYKSPYYYCHCYYY